MGSFQSDNDSNRFSKSRENCVDVPSALNRYRGTDLSGAGCGSSACPDLSRGSEKQFSGSTHPSPVKTPQLRLQLE